MVNDVFFVQEKDIYKDLKCIRTRVRSMSLLKSAGGSGLRQNDNAYCNNRGDPDFRQDRNP